MRLLYRWFCRVVGVGSALDIMNLYVIMLICIFVVFIMSLPDVDGKKHRTSRRHGHHRHNHHHRKHPRLHHQLPLNGNLTVKTKKRSDFSSKNFTVTSISNTTPWIMNQTSISSLVNSSFAAKEEMKTYRNIDSKTSTFDSNSGQTKNLSKFKNSTDHNVNLDNRTIISNSSPTPIDIDDLFNTENYKNSSQTDFRNMLVDSRITIRLIEESTSQIFTRPFVNSSPVPNTEEVKTDDSNGSLPSNSYFNITEVEEDRVVKDLEKLFGSAENRKHLADAANETPVVELIRKKRSAMVEEEEDDAVDVKTSKGTLMDFNGPPILNDPEEMQDRESPNSLHTRVKRDGSELDDDDPSLESFDSTYLRNLEDSFALSALEVQAQRSQGFNRIQRETNSIRDNVDSSVNITRNKRDLELKVEEDNTKNGLGEPLKSLTDSVSDENDYIPKNRVNELKHLADLKIEDDNTKNGPVEPLKSLTNSDSDEDNYIPKHRVNELKHLANRQSSLDSGHEEDNLNELAEGSRLTTLADRIAKSVNSILPNSVNDVEYPIDNLPTVDQGETSNYFAAGSETSTTINFLGKSINSDSRNRINDVENLSTLDQGENTDYFATGSETSSSNNFLEKNVNSILRKRVNVEHLANSSPIVDLDQGNNPNYFQAGSRTSNPADLGSEVNSDSRKRINDVEILSTLDQGKNTNYFATGSETSSSTHFLEKNVNSILRKRVNDVDHPANSPPIVDSGQGNKPNYFQAGSQTSTPADLDNVVNSTFRDRVNSIEDLSDNMYRLDFDSTNDFSEVSPTSTPTNSVLNVNSISKNRVYIDHPMNSASTLDSPQADYYSNDSAIASETSSAESFVKNVNPVLENRVNDIELHTGSSFPEKNVTKTNQDYLDKEHRDYLKGDQSRIKDAASHPQRSSSDNSILKDDNSISRYELNDVYPEIMQDLENPSPMVQLVRTKRFGDSIVYPEAPDASYANEVVNSGTVDEPYAEDNRIIDSMLSKVDYRNVDEQGRSERNENERPFNAEEIDANRSREEVAIRGKRGSFTKRTRKKIRGGRRGYGKQKKSHKGRTKKHNSKRSKKKGASRDLSKREFDVGNSLSDVDIGGQWNDDGEKVISPHDQRRRRKFDDKNYGNFYSDAKETAGRVRRDTRKIPRDFKGGSFPDTPGLGKVKVVEGTTKSRDKRNNALQELKNIKNAREAENRSIEITDKHIPRAEAVESIRDIKKIVVGLLAKVDELYGYIADGSGDVEQSKTYQGSGMLFNTSNVGTAIEIPFKVVKETTGTRSAKNTDPRPANAMTRPEGCWKHPTPWNPETKPSNNNRAARNPRGERCAKNLRRKRKSRRKWDRWTDWSSCSVTCGRGRQIRWRHCVRNCSTAETEMEEKACQLPACAPGKFLGIFG